MLSYVPAAPTAAAVIIDLAVSAAEMFGGSWEAGSGAIHAENQALRWLAQLVGWSDSAGGTFVSGGTVGNLAALHAAREKYIAEHGRPTGRCKIAHAGSAHSSIPAALRVMDVESLAVPLDRDGRLTGKNLEQAVRDEPHVAAVVATSGTTNAGIIDDLAAIAEVCKSRGIWMHVDGAYGLPGILSPELRNKYDGISEADSFIVDPHKWLFAPYDCCALVYREPIHARRAHAQHAAYLEQIDRDQWNPSDYAIHLSRRVRGLPLWFSLATYGTDKYVEAVSRTKQICDAVVAGIKERADFLELVREPDLTVILFKRKGWDLARMQAWSEVQRVAPTILCLPTFWEDEPVYRLCFVNPDTDPDYVLDCLDLMKDF
jgi:glutamate/tyrosine decarboxylase-like PLP-dependent enzyme